MATKRRKTNTALVLNPAGRSLSIGGSRRANPSKRRRRRTTSSRRRRNPIAAQALTRRRRNPIRRRSNPASTSGLIVAAVFAGLGVSLFDLVTTKFVPQQSALVRAGVKLGGAWAVQNFGGKLPLLGKHKNDIALVLAVAGVVDLMKLYVFPLVAGTAANFGLLTAPAEGDDTTGNIYGNAYNPNYIFA